jgi:23S rRNA (cytidine1920-2'-O)/16S rRNA (cytidine1409-2'-O)-methyltransferase
MVAPGLRLTPLFQRRDLSFNNGTMTGRNGIATSVRASPKAARTRQRADQLLVEQGLAESRTKAQALIIAGLVTAGGRRVDKPGTALPTETPLAVEGRDHPWVSRGGIKLAFALERFTIDVKGLIALDIGASTGGFTDVLVTHGAARVHAVDVGRGQLAWKLRQDPRVVVHEGVNARRLSRAQIPEPVDLITCDASFIGLATVLPAALSLAAAQAQLLALIKPQFEAGPEDVGKGGVVRDPAVQEAVCRRIADWIAGRPGWCVAGIAESPIKGPAGNREFLLYARRGI